MHLKLVDMIIWIVRLTNAHEGYNQHLFVIYRIICKGFFDFKVQIEWSEQINRYISGTEERLAGDAARRRQ